MSIWSLRWHFRNKSIAGAPYSIKGYSYSLSYSQTLWWRVRWLKQCRLKVAAELQQWRRRTNRRRNSVPRSSSSDRESSITQRGASSTQCTEHMLLATCSNQSTYKTAYGLSGEWLNLVMLTVQYVACSRGWCRHAVPLQTLSWPPGGG